MPKKKSVAPLVLGIISIIVALLIPIIGLILGIIGLVLATRGNKVAELSYKTEIILNSIGIGVAVINWIAGMILLALA